MARHLASTCLVALAALCFATSSLAAESRAIPTTLPPVKPLNCPAEFSNCTDPTAPYCLETVTYTAADGSPDLNGTARFSKWGCDGTLYAPTHYAISFSDFKIIGYHIECPEDSYLGYYPYYLGYGARIFACWPNSDIETATASPLPAVASPATNRSSLSPSPNVTTVSSPVPVSSPAVNKTNTTEVPTLSPAATTIGDDLLTANQTANQTAVRLTSTGSISSPKPATSNAVLMKSGPGVIAFCLETMAWWVLPKVYNWCWWLACIHLAVTLLKSTAESGLGVIAFGLATLAWWVVYNWCDGWWVAYIYLALTLLNST